MFTYVNIETIRSSLDTRTFTWGKYRAVTNSVKISPLLILFSHQWGLNINYKSKNEANTLNLYSILKTPPNLSFGFLPESLNVFIYLIQREYTNRYGVWFSWRKWR